MNDGYEISDEGLEDLVKNLRILPSLKKAYLNFAKCPRITYGEARRLEQDFPSIKIEY